MSEVRALVEAVLGRRVRSLGPLGRGTDHDAWEVDGELVARIRHDGTGEVGHEVAVLELAGRVSPIPVPEVVAADVDAGVLVVRKLPGTSLLDRPPVDPGALAGQLGGFLAALHAVPATELAGIVDRDEHPLAAHLEEAADLLTHVAAALTASQRRAVVAFLAAGPPAEPDRLVLAHNDLGAEHLLAADGVAELTGVIDWSDAALADPARDLGRLQRDLGPSTVERILADLSLADDGELRRRVAFHARCSLLEDLAHGLDAGDRRYSAAALARFAATFPAA